MSRKKQDKSDYDEAVRLLVLFLILAFFSCSSGLPLDAAGGRRSEYENYISDHLKSDHLYIKLRETASGRALLVTPKLTELQSRIAPGFQVKIPEAKTLVVVSLEMQDWSRFSIGDYKFFLGDKSSASVKEITDEQLISTLYPFSVPHDRVFLVEFEGPAQVPHLKVQTSHGQLEFQLDGA